MARSRTLRPSKNISMLEKRFWPVIPDRGGPKVDLKQDPHELTVLSDLRRGCLTSLDIYLRVNQGIADRAVAVELRKLISGSKHRAKYRLVAVSHPDGPRPARGAPRKAATVKPGRTEFRLFHAFERALKEFRKVTAATKKVMEDEGVSKDTVRRARLAVKKYNDFIEGLRARRLRVAEERDQALGKLREEARATGKRRV